MGGTNPLFVDCTWGAGGSSSEATLEISSTLQQYMGVDVMMHLTCTNMERSMIDDALKRCKECGIHNILALRGDPPKGEEWKEIEGGFKNASDLVKYIRQEHGDYFGIAVACYPEGHVDATSYEEDLTFLKEKLDCGADFAVTQLFYDVDIFIQFCKDAKALGISQPIIPGFLPIQGASNFDRMIDMCKTKVTPELKAEVHQYDGDDMKCKNFGIELVVRQCEAIKDADIGTRGFHFYTLNLERSTLAIIEKLGLYQPDSPSSRALPWRKSAEDLRALKEKTRPIFWANRPKAYISRTVQWDEFQNGRWGDSNSPAFGELSDHYLSRLVKSDTREKRQLMWGKTADIASVTGAFCSFISGEIDRLPWTETGIQSETVSIDQKLLAINRKGLLTINSQPQVNGAKSSDANVGWGPQNGYVYQKGYVEFFASPEMTTQIIELCESDPEKYGNLSYSALNSAGEERTNCEGSTNSVTWGVFPANTVQAPTVVDAGAFKIWSKEAFGLWTSEWASAYSAEEGYEWTDGAAASADSAAFIQSIKDSWFLVNIVDNDYVDTASDVFTILLDVAEATTA